MILGEEMDVNRGIGVLIKKRIWIWKNKCNNSCELFYVTTKYGSGSVQSSKDYVRVMA